jgi:hypothetical protein
MDDKSQYNESYFRSTATILQEKGQDLGPWSEDGQRACEIQEEQSNLVNAMSSSGKPAQNARANRQHAIQDNKEENSDKECQESVEETTKEESK